MHIPLPRFSVRTLFLLVAVVALGVTALLQATSLWASLTTTVTYLMLSIAIPAVVYRREAPRAFWLGFAVCGWGCVLWSRLHTTQRDDAPLVSAWGVDYAADKLMPIDGAVPYTPAAVYLAGTTQQTLTLNAAATASVAAYSTPTTTYFPYPIAPLSDRRQAFRRIGLDLGVLLFALFGGIVSSSLYATRAKEQVCRDYPATT